MDRECQNAATGMSASSKVEYHSVLCYNTQSHVFFRTTVGRVMPSRILVIMIGSEAKIQTVYLLETNQLHL